VAGDGLPHPNDNDLSWRKAGGRGAGARFAASIALWIGASSIAILFLVLVLHHVQGGTHDALSLHQQLVEVQEPWADTIAADVAAYRLWIENHGTTSELYVFDDISVVLLRGVLATSTPPSESLMSALYVSAHAGLLRALFLIIASLRLWFAAILVAGYFGFTYYKPYQGGDLLGQTGNGRLFYSGARGGLDNLSASGAPDVLVRGLACPDYATKAETHSSAIWHTLSKWSATTTTNEALTSILVKHGDTASYIPTLEDEAACAETFKGSPLAEHLPHLLEAALTLHSMYARGDVATTPEAAQPASTLSAATSQQYAAVILGALHQVLSPRLRSCIGALTPHEVATFVLALESGKIIAHSREGGKWFRRSNFPHLSARAVLHSVLSYPTEYDFEQRQRIRQALVYASRTSSFAPVRMPLGMTDDTWALRQWAEVLLTEPHQIQDAVDEIELVGLVRSAHRAWEQEILPKATSLAPDLTSTSFTTMSDLIFLPMGSIVALLRRTVEPQTLARIAHLSGIVGVKQKQRIERAQKSEEGGGTTLIYDRVFAPISESDSKTLAELHSLNPDEIAEWSALRNILASFGWLARRVGDYTVPESSVIYSVFKTPAGYPGANSLNLIGKTGLVPLRGSKFREIWGADWDRRFQCFQRATMSETKEDFERVLQGIKEAEVEDSILTTPAPA
jgi:hypothetical protein